MITVKSLLVRIGADVTEMESAFKKADGFIVEHKKQFKKAGKAIAIAGGVIVGTMGLLVKSAVGLNTEMANVATLIPGQTARIQELKTNVQSMSMAYGKATSDITGGLYNVISAFGDTSDTSKILETNVKAAAAGMADTNDAINLTSAVTKAYGETNAEAIKKVADLALLTVRLGQTTFPELAGSIGLVTGLSKELNLREEELFTTFATLTGVTGNAAKVSTQFSGILSAMIKPTDAMVVAVQKLGKEKGLGADATAKAIIQELGWKGTLEGLAAQTDGTTVGLGKLFSSKEALIGLLPLLSSQSAVYDKKLQEMENSAGALDEAFKEMSEGINKAGFDMARLKQTGIVLAQKLGDKLAPTIGKIAVAAGKVVTKLVNWIDKHPVLVGVILKVVGVLGALMTILGPFLMILPGIIAGVGAMSAGFIAVAGPIVAVIAVLTVVVAIITTLIGRAKKLKESLAKLGKTDEEIAESLGKVAEKAGMTAAEFAVLNEKYDGNYKKMVRHIQKGKLGAEMQQALADGIGKTSEKLEEEEEVLEKTEKGIGTFTKAAVVLNEKLKTLSKTLVDEVKKSLLSEYEYSKWTAEQKYQERVTAIENEIAAEDSGAEQIKLLESQKFEALKLLNEAYLLEKKDLEIEHEEEEKERKDKIAAEQGEKEKERQKKTKAQLAAYVNFKATITEKIHRLTMTELEYALWALDEETEKKADAIEKEIEDEEKRNELLKLLAQSYAEQKEKILKDSADEIQKTEEDAAEAVKEAWRKSLEKIHSYVNSILGMIGNIFRDSLQLKLNLIEKEERERLDSIDTQYDAQIDSMRKLMDAEEKKTEEILDKINEEYDAKKLAIETNIKDEELKAAALRQLEEDRAAELKAAREEREIAEKETADALMKIEDEKNEAIRLASEELEKKRSEARRKAARQEKAVALISAIVNTAAGVVKALASGIPPFNIILAAITAAAGAIQIALIKSTPLPMKEGGIVTKRTEILAGEAGPEAIIPLKKLMPFLDGGGLGRGLTVYSTVNIYPRSLDDSTIRGASEKLFDAAEREIKRRYPELLKAY